MELNTKKMITINPILSEKTISQIRKVIAKVEKQASCVMVIEELQASQEPKKIEKKLKKSLDIS